MERRSLFHYYWFGTCVRYLQDATIGKRLGADDPAAGGIRYNIKQLLQGFANFNLQVTLRAARPLQAMADEWHALPDDHALSAEEAKRLSREVTTLRHTLEAEIEGFAAYLATPKRFSETALADDASQLFAPGIFSRLPAIARFDIKEAGRCILFELPTAAGFHLMRATEAALREFYCAIAKQKRVELMWGPMVRDLRTRRKATPYATLLDHLDHIRTSFRNPTQHPDKIYDIHEIQDFLGVVVDVLSRMAIVLPVETTAPDPA